MTAVNVTGETYFFGVLWAVFDECIEVIITEERGSPGRIENIKEESHRFWYDSSFLNGTTLIRQAFLYSCISFEFLKALRGEEWDPSEPRAQNES